MSDPHHLGGLPASSYRWFGISHLLGGTIQMILAFVQIGLTGRDEDDLWNPSPSRWQTFLQYPPIAVLFASIVMITAGLLGVGAPMSYNYHRQTSLVSSFKLLTLIIGVMFGPLVMGIGITYATLHDVDEDMGSVGLVIAIFSGLTTTIALCASCMTCCYSPFNDEPWGMRPTLGGDRYGGGAGFGEAFGDRYAARYDSPSLDFASRDRYARRY